jgi:hypothetical protein
MICGIGAAAGYGKFRILFVRRPYIMTLLKLAGTLPNGLHDSEVSELAISYADRTIRLAINVWVGDMDNEASRESYRKGVIMINDFVYCVLDRPDVNYPYESAHVLTIDVVEPDELVTLNGNGEACRLWVSEWNGFIHIRAGDATLKWLGPEVVRR